MEISEMEEENEFISKIENDDFYKSFLHSNIKNELLQKMTIAEQVKKLGEGIEQISQELQKQVFNKHNDLIRQANHANNLEVVLNIMNVHVQNLFANAERLKTQVMGPYQILENHTMVLSRLDLASHILRQVNRIQQLSKRLNNVTDPVQKASVLQELEQLAADPDLTDIDAVTSELRNIRSQQQKVIRLATSSLTQGIINENSTQTNTALQIFLNLGTLESVTQNLIESSLNDCKESLKYAFDTSANSYTAGNANKGGPGRAALSSSQGFRTKIWGDLEKAFMEEIYQQCKQIKFLQGAISNMSGISPELNIAIKFWKSLNELVVSEISNAASAVQQMIETDYPKLLKSFTDLVKKLNYEHFQFSRNVLDKWENSYLSNSLNRLLEPTQAMFTPENNSPNHDQIDSLMRTVTNELSVAIVEDNLCEKVAKNISNCVKMFCVKTEQQLATGPEAAQVIAGMPNTGQQLNVNLANALYYMQTQIQRMLVNMKETLPVNVANVINDSLQSLTTLTKSILDPLIASISTTIETIIVTIHLEQDWPKLPVPANKNAVSASPYMRELTQFIARVYHTYLVTFDNKEVLSVKCGDIAVRCIELLVRHSSLLRPISPGGRIRLQADYAHLENALKVLCPYLTDLGRPYRLLKSVATLITLSPAEIVASQASGSSVPHSTVLLILFSFAGSELASPHQNAGWSLNKISSWLDEHPAESDRLDLIIGALQRYEAIIRQKNSVNYDPVYPIMSEFLATAVKSK